MAAVSMTAQKEDVFQFVDKSGAVVSDGSVVNASELTEDEFLGNYINPGLFLKNVSGEAANVRMAYEIETIDNGDFQICFPVSCMRQSAVGSYVTTDGPVAAAESRDLQCEWFPMAYGTCRVKLSVEVMSALHTKLADGPSITVVFSYSDPARIDEASSHATRLMSHTSRDLSGRPVSRHTSHASRIVIVRQADGTVRKQTIK
jgi:hypothetical protein